MLTEDYLMRYIRLVTQALAKALGLRTSGLYTDALFAIDQAMSQVVGMQPELFRRLDDSSILSMLTGSEGLDTDRLLLVADLIREEGQIYADMGNPAESAWRFQRALGFYIEVVLDGGAVNLPQPHDQIQALVTALKDTDLSPELAFNLFSYYDQVGQYSQAKILIDRLLSTEGGMEDLSDVAREFYERLTAKNPAELRAAGIDPSEIKKRLENITQQ